MMPVVKIPSVAEKNMAKARLAAMKAADAGSADKLKHTAAVAEGATFAEKFELVKEVMQEVPDLDVNAASVIAEEYYNEETGDREAIKKAAMIASDSKEREQPSLLANETTPRRKEQGWEGSAIPTMPTNDTPNLDNKPDVE